jgi:hypothetical protein
MTRKRDEAYKQTLQTPVHPCSCYACIGPDVALINACASPATCESWSGESGLIPCLSEQRPPCTCPKKESTHLHITPRCTAASRVSQRIKTMDFSCLACRPVLVLLLRAYLGVTSLHVHTLRVLARHTASTHPVHVGHAQRRRRAPAAGRLNDNICDGASSQRRQLSAMRERMCVSTHLRPLEPWQTR